MASTYNELMQKIVEEYRQTGNSWPATTHDIASWAVRSRRWEPPRELAIDRCADDLAKAMREEFITDRQGRRVRAKHAARREVNGEQQTFWADLRTAPREHMEVAFAQRRQQVVADCAQLKRDVDSYNDNFNKNDEPIQMVFDFTMDLAEMEAVAPSARQPTAVDTQRQEDRWPGRDSWRSPRNSETGSTPVTSRSSRARVHAT